MYSEEPKKIPKEKTEFSGIKRCKKRTKVEKPQNLKKDKVTISKYSILPLILFSLMSSKVFNFASIVCGSEKFSSFILSKGEENNLD
ncbi:hypothetical protein JWG44_16850 [Leptospira sp. 201903071]|uniref:hypothetical protein n=1 Tax=Leptospira ainazelensis TaxID=2810034 RepID=UPI001963645C|nr:hypothetical protein [Leptospira ainazelensis]MBM9501926.1 hypothetical protein [Leptospira ainazelensis]